MKVAHDFNALKECIAVWGLRENRRDSQRYQVDIEGDYHVEQKGLPVIRGTCRLVDVNKGGIAVKMVNVQFHEGSTLHLQFFPGLSRVTIVGRAVHIDWEDDGYRVGIQALSKKTNIVEELLGAEPEK